MPHFREKTKLTICKDKKTRAIYPVNCTKYVLGPARSWGFSVVSAQRRKIASVAGINGYKNTVSYVPFLFQKCFPKMNTK